MVKLYGAGIRLIAGATGTTVPDMSVESFGESERKRQSAHHSAHVLNVVQEMNGKMPHTPGTARTCAFHLISIEH